MTALATLRGANYWSRHPVTRMDLDIGPYEDISSAHVPGVPERLVAALPGLVEHRCSVGARGGFIRRLREGTYAGHIVEHVALELQAMVGHEVGYGRTRGAGRAGSYTLVFEHRHHAVGLRAAALALEIVQRAFSGALAPDDVAHAVAELRAIALTPDAPALQQRVCCGVTGGGARAETREALAALGIGTGSEDDIVVDVSPAYLLQAGLPYAHAAAAVILDAAPVDVPERYRDPDRAARLVSIVADAVAPHGAVVCADDAQLVHHILREAGRRVVKFAPAPDVREHARRAAAAVAAVLGAPELPAADRPALDGER